MIYYKDKNVSKSKKLYEILKYMAKIIIRLEIIKYKKIYFTIYYFI